MRTGRDGTPYAVTATQRLDVHVLGDYLFTIGAPVRDVARAPGSESDPGLRATSIVWAGFDPGRRVLAARATLDPALAEEGLPARLDGRRLVNTTGITVSAFTADAEKGSVLGYLTALRAALRAGRTPAAGFANLTSRARATKLHIVVPLVVRGTVGTTTVATTFTGALELPPGRVDLRVEPAVPTVTWSPADDGRTLLEHAIRSTLTVARMRQYETFLGNPDPAGTSRTSYRYLTGTPPAVAAPVAPVSGHGPWRMVLVALGVLAAAGAALAVWVRS